MKKTIIRFLFYIIRSSGFLTECYFDYSVRPKHLGTFLKKYYPKREEMYTKISYTYYEYSTFYIHDRRIIEFCKVHLLPVVNKYEWKNVKDMIISTFISGIFNDLYNNMYYQVRMSDRMRYHEIIKKRNVVINSFKQKVGLV